MKYYNEILDLGIFTRQDIQKIIKNSKTAESFLSRSLKKGYIKRININYICLFDYLFISSQMSAKPYFIGSTGILLLW